MLKEIHVWNREQAEALEPSGVIISIYAPQGRTNFPANLREGWQDRLTLCFEDAEPHTNCDNSQLFNEDMAKQVIAFAEKHVNVMEWHIHCDAGMSRSVGVGVMLADMFRRELSLHAVGTTQHANNYVMTVIKRMQWVDHFRDSQDVWEIAKRNTLR